jgi:hypothetical protein
VVDFDLSILGAERERFEEYEAGVRREYAHCPDEVFREAARLLAAAPGARAPVRHRGDEAAARGPRPDQPRAQPDAPDAFRR